MLQEHVRKQRMHKRSVHKTRQQIIFIYKTSQKDTAQDKSSVIVQACSNHVSSSRPCRVQVQTNLECERTVQMILISTDVAGVKLFHKFIVLQFNNTKILRFISIKHFHAADRSSLRSYCAGRHHIHNTWFYIPK